MKLCKNGWNENKHWSTEDSLLLVDISKKKHVSKNIIINSRSAYFTISGAFKHIKPISSMTAYDRNPVLWSSDDTKASSVRWRRPFDVVESCRNIYIRYISVHIYIYNYISDWTLVFRIFTTQFKTHLRRRVLTSVSIPQPCRAPTFCIWAFYAYYWIEIVERWQETRERERCHTDERVRVCYGWCLAS